MGLSLNHVQGLPVGLCVLYPALLGVVGSAAAARLDVGHALACRRNAGRFSFPVDSRWAMWRLRDGRVVALSAFTPIVRKAERDDG